MRTAKILLFAALGVATLVKCSKDSSGTESFSGTGLAGSTARFSINGNSLYTVNSTELKIFSIANGAAPSSLGTFKLGQNIETISSRDNQLFIGSQNGVYLVDVTVPSSPSLLGLVRHVLSCDPVVPDGNKAFVTLSSNTGCRGINQLDILDITDIQNATIVKSYPMDSPRGLGVDGNYLFVCDNGIKMYDKSNIFNLIEKDYKLGVPANDVIADNNILIVTAEDGIYQYNYSTGKLVFLSKILKSL